MLSSLTVLILSVSSCTIYISMDRGAESDGFKGKITDEQRFDVVRHSCPGSGACGGMFTYVLSVTLKPEEWYSLWDESQSQHHELCTRSPWTLTTLFVQHSSRASWYVVYFSIQKLENY
jgi:hypothetical protein